MMKTHNNYGTIDLVKDQLDTLFCDRVSYSDALREHHGNDVSWHEAQLPDAVVFPLNQDEIVELVKLANKYKIPLIPFGAGTPLFRTLVKFLASETRDLFKFQFFTISQPPIPAR